MKILIDTLWFLRGIDTAKEQLNENRVNKLREIRDEVSGEFEKYYKL